MTLPHARPRRRIHMSRIVGGSLLEMFVKAYGGAASTAVALGSAETTSGKFGEAVAAVPTLREEYDRAQYVVDHRAEIQTAITYLNENSPSQEELQGTVQESTETIGRISTTYDALSKAKDETFSLTPNVFTIKDHVDTAWNARPDAESIGRLGDAAETLAPLMDQVDVLLPAYYGGFLTITDNFASNEIGSTLTVMGLAFAFFWLLGKAVGFFVRRGRPGALAHLLQSWGARTFPKWYGRHLHYALGPALYGEADAYVQRQIATDPEAALNEDTYEALQAHFAERVRRQS